MRHTLLALAICLALTASTVWAAGVTVSAGTSQALHADHGFHATTVTEGQKDVTLQAIGDTIAGVPICTDHDPTVWHPIVKRDPSGQIICTYGHEHGDDPAQLDALFGPPNAWWGGTQSISYPWHTPMENEMKHWFYKYLVRTDLQPLPGLQLPAFRSLYMRNIRAVGHLEGFSAAIDGMQMGFPILNHSYSYEVEICKQGGSCGTMQVGGWQYYGHGLLSGQGVEPCVLNCSTPDGVDPGVRHIHGGPDSYRRDFTWYGSSSAEAAPDNAIRFSVGLGTIGEATGYVDPNDYATLHQYPPDTAGTTGPLTNAYNGSWESLEVTSVVVPAEMDALDGATDGYVTWSGYATHWGVLRPAGACTAPDVDCVPMKFVNAPVGVVQYRDSQHNATYGTKFGAGQEHDVLVPFGTAPNGQPNNASLIRFPN